MAYGVLDRYETYDDTGDGPFEVTVAAALQDTLAEFESWPRVRVLIPYTGEVIEGQLFQVLHHIARAVSDGFDVRVEADRG